MSEREAASTEDEKVASPPAMQVVPVAEQAEEEPSVEEPPVEALSDGERQRRLVECELRLQGIGVEIVQACLALEAHLHDIKRCKDKSVAFFNSCDTHADRYLAFDELTAMLGEGAPPREGFEMGDWRAKGCRGYRPLAVLFFSKVSLLAEERLLAEELRKGKRPLVPEYVCDGNRGRWGFTWDGVDLVTKVLHSLDFLRQVREVANWYGRNFSFLGNPLALPFPLRFALEELEGMDECCSQLLESQAFMRRGIGAVGGTRHWRHRKYLGKWYKAFFALCEAKMQWNWPKIEEVKLVEEYEPVFNAMCAIYIRNLPSVTETAAFEKKFVSLIMTSRGNHLMQGSSGLKPDRPLALPRRYRMPIDEEVDRSALLSQFMQKPASPDPTPQRKSPTSAVRAKTPVVDDKAAVTKEEAPADVVALMFGKKKATSARVLKKVEVARAAPAHSTPASVSASASGKRRPPSARDAPASPPAAAAAEPPRTSSSAPASNPPPRSSSASAKRGRVSMMRKALEGQTPSKSVLASQAHASRVSRVSSAGPSEKKMTRKTVLPPPVKPARPPGGSIRLGNAPPAPLRTTAMPVLLVPIKKKV